MTEDTRIPPSPLAAAASPYSSVLDATEDATCVLFPEVAARVAAMRRTMGIGGFQGLERDLIRSRVLKEIISHWKDWYTARLEEDVSSATAASLNAPQEEVCQRLDSLHDEICRAIRAGKHKPATAWTRWLQLEPLHSVLVETTEAQETLRQAQDSNTTSDDLCLLTMRVLGDYHALVYWAQMLPHMHAAIEELGLDSRMSEYVEKLRLESLLNSAMFRNDEDDQRDIPTPSQRALCGFMHAEVMRGQAIAEQNREGFRAYRAREQEMHQMMRQKREAATPTRKPVGTKARKL